MKRKQRDLIEFALRYECNWNGFATDRETVELVSATANLGIIKVNEFGQFKLKSREAAERFLNN